MQKIILALFLCILVAKNSIATDYINDNIDLYSTSITGKSLETWDAHTTLDTTGGYNGSKGIKTLYSSSGVNSGTSISVASFNLPELYVRFYAKVDCGAGQCAGGTKFLKLFSKNNGGYANSTMRLVYETGNIEGIAAGSGATTQNDDGNVMFLNGTKPWSPALLSMNTSEVNYTGTYSGHKDGQWHCYEMYMKFNSNGNSDGEYKLWIDGVYKLHATNVKNRHDANIREFDYITLGGYSSSSQWTTPFTIWFDNIIVSDSHIGTLCGYPNGIMDGDEVGIDCGGPCASCPPQYVPLLLKTEGKILRWIKP